MANVRMVWWDVGRVLYHHRTDEMSTAIGAIAKPKLRPHEAYAKIRQSGLVAQYDLGAITTEQFTEEMRKLLNFSDDSEFISIWANVFTPNQAVWRIVTKLGQNDYHQGIISNINELQMNSLETRVGLGAIMQFWPRIYSCRERVAKPNKLIFARAFMQTNEELFQDKKLRPWECVFIDDVLENIEAARALGLYAIHHNPVFSTQTEFYLAELGVRI